MFEEKFNNPLVITRGPREISFAWCISLLLKEYSLSRISEFSEENRNK